MARRLLATLLTDFGTRDPYVAAMKGVILSRCGRADLVDISHDIPPQDVFAAALILAQAAPYFPPETLHVVVVDPGVGTGRPILAARYGGQRFLFPDNGVITQVEAAWPQEEIVAVRNTRYVPSSAASMTFHGRDLFAPVAAHLLNGLPLRELGPRPDTYKLLDLPAPRIGPGRIDGEVLYVDAFGNLITNISAEMVTEQCEDVERVTVDCGEHAVGAVRGTYAHVQRGEALALFNSMRLLEVAVNQGRADEALGCGRGTGVVVTAPPPKQNGDAR